MRSVNNEDDKICLFFVGVTLLIVTEMSEEIRGLRIFVWKLLRLFSDRSVAKKIHDCVRGVESSQYNNFSNNTMPTRPKIVLVAVGQCSQINIAASRDDPKKLVYNRIKKIMYRWKTPDSIKT